jgi:predicted DNA binding CopG/RHH family protein
MKREAKPINDIKDIPPNLSDEDHIAFLETHGVSEEFLERTEEVPENERPRPRTQPINVRFDSFTLGRLKDLANRRNVGYQTLLKEFVVERLYEEEKREGMLTAGHPREAHPQPGAAEQPRGINTAAKEFADVLIESYQTVAGHGDSAYELSDQRAEQFFNSVINNLQTQAEANLQIAPELAPQRGQEASRQPVTQEFVQAYMNFLNFMFSSSQEDRRAAKARRDKKRLDEFT